MANQEHLQMLKRGVEAWNKWRKGNGYITRPDLRAADLWEASLSGADLRGRTLPARLLVRQTLVDQC